MFRRPWRAPHSTAFKVGVLRRNLTFKQDGILIFKPVIGIQKKVDIVKRLPTRIPDARKSQSWTVNPLLLIIWDSASSNCPNQSMLLSRAKCGQRPKHALWQIIKALCRKHCREPWQVLVRECHSVWLQDLEGGHVHAHADLWDNCCTVLWWIVARARTPKSVNSIPPDS